MRAPKYKSDDAVVEAGTISGFFTGYTVGYQFGPIGHERGWPDAEVLDHIADALSQRFEEHNEP